MKPAALLKRFMCVHAGLMIFFFTTAAAQGNLLITPRRVVFEGPKRLQELNLANTGRDTARYMVSFIEIRMKDDGTFENITAPDSSQRFASSYLRFFPRSVTLAPNEAQIVKVQLEKAGQLQPGEYRSHIYFRAIPNEEPLGEEDTPKGGSLISVRLTPIFGLSIPVIIRVGESTAKVQLTDLSLTMANDTLPRLQMTFLRSGNMSVYGDVTVDLVSPQGKTTPVGIVKGVAVYTPGQVRQFHMDLSNAKGTNYHTGKLRVAYTTQVNNKPVTLAATELVLH
jgi:P pilus assembly chaperone PapD